jgi:hypothetical protein
MKKLATLTFMAASLASTNAAILIESYTFNNGGAVPDTAGTPFSDTRTISQSLIDSITDVAISVQLINPAQAGAFNGDYYMSLQHSSGFSVLLNRVGRAPGSSFGYSDNGFNVTFSDSAANGDIHVYRQTAYANGPVDPTFTQPLTGSWAPDGRETSPLQVATSDSRTALLSSFNNLAGNGTWTLQIIDFNTGGVATLDQWSLSLTGVGVPEPAATAALTAAALGLFALIRKRR